MAAVVALLDDLMFVSRIQEAATSSKVHKCYVCSNTNNATKRPGA